GAEATKNAVLSKVGPGGFKKSLRHDNFMPDYAVVDPELTLTCPRAVTAACGMDAFTQLLEAYVSTAGNPMTDALAFGGLEMIASNLELVCGAGADDIEARGGMSYAALMSGVALANAGLGAVHGLAGPLGGLFKIPHGAACGAIMAPAVALTVDALLDSDPGNPALAKFARVGALFADGSTRVDVQTGCARLVEKIYSLTESLGIPRLGEFGVAASDLDGIVAASDSKYNPVKLSPEQLKSVLEKSL
ncbi:MAG TPA: iron-containing alcohol dehydrogenase, partial [bacterium]|nr:iron-containing alcohol dehydrogenase [bacterium]